MSHATCDACGHRLPTDPWMTNVCSAGCVDALVASWERAPVHAPAAGPLHRFLATA